MTLDLQSVTRDLSTTVGKRDVILERRTDTNIKSEDGIRIKNTHTIKKDWRFFSGKNVNGKKSGSRKVR